MMKQIEVTSIRRFQHISLLKRIQAIIEEEKLQEAVLMIQCPSSTTGLTFMKQNEDLSNDMLYGMEKTFPAKDEFFHYCGNTSAHLKSANMGNTLFLMIHEGKLLLEEKEDIVFCEFDGAKKHIIYVKVMSK